MQCCVYLYELYNLLQDTTCGITVAPADNARNVTVAYCSTLFDNSLYECGFLPPT